MSINEKQIFIFNYLYLLLRICFFAGKSKFFWGVATPLPQVAAIAQTCANKGTFGFILEKFANERKIYDYYITNLPEIDKKLAEGAAKTRPLALETLKRVRGKLGF